MRIHEDGVEKRTKLPLHAWAQGFWNKLRRRRQVFRGKKTPSCMDEAGRSLASSRSPTFSVTRK
jgi:hypothetical protein